MLHCDDCPWFLPQKWRKKHDTDTKLQDYAQHMKTYNTDTKLHVYAQHTTKMTYDTDTKLHD